MSSLETRKLLQGFVLYFGGTNTMVTSHIHGVEILKAESPYETLHIISKLLINSVRLLHDLNKIGPTLHPFHGIMEHGFPLAL